VIHTPTAPAALRLPPEPFARDSWLTTPRRCEHDGRLYRDWFAIRKWKSLLPDGAPWLGGFGKKKLRGRNRADLAHWCMLACLPVFFVWNSPWACWMMTVYAIAANLPCILAQRYNRLAF